MKVSSLVYPSDREELNRRCEALPLSNHLSSHADDTSVHQLLDLGPNLRVPQVLLKSRRVVLGLL
jgi:hypothetical protein